MFSVCPSVCLFGCAHVTVLGLARELYVLLSFGTECEVKSLFTQAQKINLLN